MIILTDDHLWVKGVPRGENRIFYRDPIENNGLRQVFFRLNCLLRIRDDSVEMANKEVS
jgi:hypothetical protein